MIARTGSCAAQERGITEIRKGSVSRFPDAEGWEAMQEEIVRE